MRTSGVLLVATLALLGLTRPAAGCGYGGLPSPVARFALADCVVVGKVTTIESKTISALLPGGTGHKGVYTVAVIAVGEMLKGEPGLTHLRVGLYGGQVLREGYEACFFLTEHQQESFFVQGASLFDYPVYKQGNRRFATDLATFRHLGKLLRDPLASLKSAKAEDRFQTAALLISRWRTYRPGFHLGQSKTERVDGVTSRLVLKVLAEADWSRVRAGRRLTAWRLFSELGLTPKDGWNLRAFRTMKDLETACKVWLKANADFRIRAFAQR